MQTQRRAWKCFQQYNVVNFVVSSCVVAALVLHLADAKQSVEVNRAHIQPVVLSECVHSVSAESVQARNLSMSSVQTRHTATILDAALVEEKQRTQQSNAYLKVFDTDQHCISGNAFQNDQNTDMAYKVSIMANMPAIFATSSLFEGLMQQALPLIHTASHKRSNLLMSLPSVSQPHGFLSVSGRSMSRSMLQGNLSNVFPYGQCTWWANQRYHQLHGIFVPWRTDANAFQWVARAIEYGWHVSGTPTVGSIMVLQPYVDGAYALGHVGVVERILQNGSVVASSMNWGNRPGAVTQATYTLRSGVSFVSVSIPSIGS